MCIRDRFEGGPKLIGLIQLVDVLVCAICSFNSVGFYYFHFKAKCSTTLTIHGLAWRISTENKIRLAKARKMFKTKLNFDFFLGKSY